MRQNISKLSLYCVATTASWGSSGSGEAKSACNESRTVRKVMAAAQLSFRMSKQMAPVTDEMLGCQIFVRNLTFGGLKGYVSGTWISSKNVPSSYGVSKKLAD